jgi:hypothetical protein
MASQDDLDAVRATMVNYILQLNIGGGGNSQPRTKVNTL